VWAAAPGYAGPIRIRGAQIDGNERALFGGPDNLWRGSPIKSVSGTAVYPELDFIETHSTFPGVPAGWRLWPTGLYIPQPGCYRLQIDGLGFSELITLQALRLPVLAPGDACPVSHQQTAHDLASQFGSGAALGDGPIYPVVSEMAPDALVYRGPAAHAWAAFKVLWILRPGSRGAIVRAAQLDGPNQVGFFPPETKFALQLSAPAPNVWGEQPSEIDIRSPGCYAFEVDGGGVSETIVFKVVQAS
jgi:hypothetical protein